MYGAVDIGGTKTLVAVFNSDGKIIEEQKFSTSPDYIEFIKELANNVAKFSTKKIEAVTVAAPGKIDRKNGIGLAFGNLPWLKVPLVDDIQNIFKVPVFIENDSKLAALSEAHNVSKQFRKVLYITISTGIGGGLIIDGKIPPDFEDIEPGHMLLEHQGKLMRWEEFASGKAIVAAFGKKAGDIPANDTKAWYTIARNIAIGLIDLIANYTPEVIILGGGVGSHYEKFIDHLNEELTIYKDQLLTIPPVIKALYPEEAVVYGCYQLTKEKYGKAT